MTTTITTALLKQIAFQLGTTPDRLFGLIRARFGVTINDTPRDETERDMSKMTITQEQFEAAQEASYRAMTKEGAASSTTGYAAFAAALGITIAPPDPSEAMVKLAREIYLSTDAPEGVPLSVACVLAGLQHAVAKAEKPLQSYADPVTGDVYIHQRTYLRELGAA